MDEGQAEWQTEWNNAKVAAARVFGDAMPESNMAWNQLTHGHTLTFCDLNSELSELSVATLNFAMAHASGGGRKGANGFSQNGRFRPQKHAKTVQARMFQLSRVQEGFVSMGNRQSKGT